MQKRDSEKLSSLLSLLRFDRFSLYKCKVHGLNPFNKREIKGEEVERLQGRFNELLTENSTKLSRVAVVSSGSIRKKYQTKQMGRQEKK